MVSKAKKCKGVTRMLQKRVFNSMTIENVCFSRKEQHRKMNVIRSHCHVMYTEEINKIAHSSDDDKRIIMADGIHTPAYGHTNLKKL